MDFACVPDISYEPLSTVAEKHVVTEMRITGTNTGPIVLGDFGKALLGADVVPPTNRPIDLPAVFVHEVRDDGFVEAERQVLGVAGIPRPDRRHQEVNRTSRGRSRDEVARVGRGGSTSLTGPWRLIRESGRRLIRESGRERPTKAATAVPTAIGRAPDETSLT